jgi:hypothetical protein
MSNAIRLLVTAIVVAAVSGCGGTAEGPDSGDLGATGGTADVVARIGDHEITLEDVDKKGREIDSQTYQALYESRKRALDGMITDYVLETEAQARGITKEELVEQEVNQKSQLPTAEQIQAFYEQNKAAMRGRTLEETSAQIKTFLANQSRQGAMNVLLGSLRQKTPVEISLEPPRVAVTIAANDPTKGPADAPVQVLEFSDFQ